MTICRRRVYLPDDSVGATSRSGEDMAYGPRQPYRRPTVLATLETRGAKGMHTRPCGNHFLRSFAGRKRRAGITTFGTRRGTPAAEKPL
jgi:hypothetical protein